MIVIMNHHFWWKIKYSVVIICDWYFNNTETEKEDMKLFFIIPQMIDNSENAEESTNVVKS